MITDLNKKKILIIFFIFIFITIILRLIHLNFEDYWFDEINSFWLADPGITDQSTYIQRYLNPGQPDQITFYFILKYFFKIFGYSDIVGRYFPFIFGCLSVPIIAYSSFKIKNNNSFLFLFFLLSINTYLIGYSQEVRVYSLLLFICSINIFTFIKLINNINKKSKWYLYLAFLISNIISVSLHIFAFLIIISEIVFLFYLYYSKKSPELKLLMVTFLSLLFALIFNYEFIFFKYNINTWIPALEPKFFFDFFFSKFFGSKIMGSIYLLTLIYLLMKFKSLKLNKNKNLFFLLILITCTYLIPIIYSFIVRPILIDRYIIFVLIPILVLITQLIWSLKNKKIKYFFIFILSISTITNSFIELAFKKVKKPQFTQVLNNINSKISRNVSFDTNVNTEFIMLSNYFFNKNTFQQKNLKIVKFNQINDLPKVWVICYSPLNAFHCSNKFSSMKKMKSVEVKSFYLAELFLLVKK